MPANPLTIDQLSEAALLKQIFQQWQQRRRHETGSPISQEKASGLLGFGQSALSQYLNGKIPLNVDAATKIAELVGCAVSDFSVPLAKQAAKYAATATNIPESTTPADDPRIARILKIAQQMDPAQLDTAVKVLDAIAQPSSNPDNNQKAG